MAAATATATATVRGCGGQDTPCVAVAAQSHAPQCPGAAVVESVEEQPPNEVRLLQLCFCGALKVTVSVCPHRARRTLEAVHDMASVVRRKVLPLLCASVATATPTRPHHINPDANTNRFLHLLVSHQHAKEHRHRRAASFARWLSVVVQEYPTALSLLRRAFLLAPTNTPLSQALSQVSSTSLVEALLLQLRSKLQKSTHPTQPHTEREK